MFHLPRSMNVRFVSFALALIAVTISVALLSHRQPVTTAQRIHPSGLERLSPSVSGTSDAATKALANQAYGRLPLSFEANQGQTDPQVKFLSRQNGYSLFLTPTEAVLAFKKPSRGKHTHPGLPPSQASTTSERRSPQPPSVVASAAFESSSPAAILRMKLVGGNASAKITGADELTSKRNYFIGNDPSKWRTGVANYGKISYEGVYRGIDLVYYGN